MPMLIPRPSILHLLSQVRQLPDGPNGRRDHVTPYLTPHISRYRYVNCLMVQTEDVPVALCAAAGWAGPEGLFVVTRRPDFAAARERIAGGDGDGPHGGALSLWAITRNLIEVPSSRDTFDYGSCALHSHTHPSCSALNPRSPSLPPAATGAGVHVRRSDA